MSSVSFQLETRKQITINTDPQRRCYYGVNASEATAWSDWICLEFNIKEEKAEERLKFWRELNDYSQSVGGKKSEFRIKKIINN